MFSTIDKAIASFLMPALVAAAEGAITGVGATGHFTWQTFASMFFTGLITYLVPNKKA